MNYVKILIAGGHGFAGSNILNWFHAKGFRNILAPTKNELNFLRQGEVEEYFKIHRPEYVIIAAGKVGGIMANRTYPADFIYENTQIWLNLIHTSYSAGVKKLIFLGSSTIYPQESSQPLKEEYILEGKLEKNVEPYAIAKILAIKMCKYYYVSFGANFIPVTLANLYGANDRFDPDNSHVVPSLIMKFYEAKLNHKKQILVWGTGKPSRDFLHVEDLASAISFCIENINANQIFDAGIDHINIGSGVEVTIKDLCQIIADTVYFEGEIEFDTSKPDGTMRKVLDISRIKSLGWSPRISLRDGIAATCNWYNKHISEL